MNEYLTGQSEAFTVIATRNATDEDMQQIASFVGDNVNPEDVAIVEAVAFDDSQNANGWKVETLDSVEVLGAALNYDHVHEASKSFGTVFAARNEGNKKIVKALIPKSGKNADVLTDIKYKVAKYTSPGITVHEWADAKSHVIRKGRMAHLSFTDEPAYGTSNRVLSLAASIEQDEAKRFEELGRKVHAENVTAATRYAERRSGHLSSAERDDLKAKYEAMAPVTLHGEVLPMLRELATKQAANSSQKTVSAITDNSTVKTVKPVLFPSEANNLFGGSQ